MIITDVAPATLSSALIGYMMAHLGSLAGPSPRMRLWIEVVSKLKMKFPGGMAG